MKARRAQHAEDRSVTRISFMHEDSSRGGSRAIARVIPRRCRVVCLAQFDFSSEPPRRSSIKSFPDHSLNTSHACVELIIASGIRRSQYAWRGVAWRRHSCPLATLLLLILDSVIILLTALAATLLVGRCGEWLGAAVRLMRCCKIKCKQKCSNALRLLFYYIPLHHILLAHKSFLQSFEVFL